MTPSEAIRQHSKDVFLRAEIILPDRDLYLRMTELGAHYAALSVQVEDGQSLAEGEHTIRCAIARLNDDLEHIERLSPWGRDESDEKAVKKVNAKLAKYQQALAAIREQMAPPQAA